jgi:hypothetical protein
MRRQCPCGLAGELGQYDEPVWEPLLRVVGDRLVETFMWMHETVLEDGTVLHAYKHIYTRRYLYLTESGAAFEYAPCGAYVPLRLDYALEAALCNWWLLAGWDADDARAVHDAVLRANRSVGEAV